MSQDTSNKRKKKSMSARETIPLNKLIIATFKRSISLIFVKKKMSQRVQNYILKHLALLHSGRKSNSAILGFPIHIQSAISISNWLSFQVNMRILQLDGVGEKKAAFCWLDHSQQETSWSLILAGNVSMKQNKAVCSFTAPKPLQCWQMQLRGNGYVLL